MAHRSHPADNGEGYAEELQGYAMRSEAEAVVAEAYRESCEGLAVERETERWIAMMTRSEPAPGGGGTGEIVRDLDILATVQQARADIGALAKNLESLSRELDRVERLTAEQIVVDAAGAADSAAATADLPKKGK